MKIGDCQTKMEDVSENPPVPAQTETGQESCSAAAAATAAAAAASAIQREERSKVLRERQNEERQRKLEELKQQALATQKFREQQEEERRRRMEEQRLRDLERRTQVEERKKAILEAERERREAMLRRSEDRGIRQELKRRNERGSIAFAFGSSTPRMLEPVDSCSSYWGSRRATSTTNVMSSSSHGRVTMNEASTPSNGTNNKRASSVFGLDQNQGDDLMTQSTSAVQGGRRKRTDLIPTIPVHRGESDRSPRSPLYASSSGASSSRGSVSRSTGLRSGDITPSSPTRPLSALSQVSSVSTTVASSVSGHVRARTAPAGGRKPRPVSIAGTGMSLSEAARASRASRENISRERSKEIKEKENERTRQTQPRPARARSADMRKDNNNVQTAAAGGASAATTPKTPESQPQTSTAKRNRDARTTSAKEARTPVKASVEPSKSAKNNNKTMTDEVKPKLANVKQEPVPSVQISPATDVQPETLAEAIDVKVEETTSADVLTPVAAQADLMMNSLPGDLPDVEVPLSTTNDVVVSAAQSDVSSAEQAAESTTSGATTPSEGSVSGDAPTQSRKIISSEEEARAALAEKRRLAREQMEREAERERLRAEEDRRLEEERQRQEELEQKLAEEEMDRLALEARKAEEERLQKAIEETQRREEEERLRREEEVRQRAEKEQQDRKAREEAERLRKENEERLRREEEERQERRKRVEAIMARTRGKSGGPGKAGNDTVSSGQSTTDVTAVGISNSISQPDLLGDIVNKTNGGNSNGQSPTDDSVDTKKNNGFHIDATDSMSPSANTTSDLPDISNVIANSNADSVNSNANNNIADEHVELVA